MTSPRCKFKPTAKYTSHSGIYQCPNSPVAYRDDSAPTITVHYNRGKPNEQQMSFRPLIYEDLCYYHEGVVEPRKVGKEVYPKEVNRG